MTVGQLIEILKKYPADYYIGIENQDDNTVRCMETVVEADDMMLDKYDDKELLTGRAIFFY